MGQLENEVNYLITALRQIDDTLASDIRTTFQHFQNFVTLDQAASIAQEELMLKALELIDIKANQTALQKVLEQIKEIKKEAGKQMGKLIKYSDAFTYMFKHPIRAVKNMLEAFNDRKNTWKALKTFVKENRKKCAFLLLGSLGIAVASGGLLTGVVLAVDILIESIAFGAVVYSTMLITSSAGVYFPVANLALTGGRILPFQLEAQENIKKLLEQTKPYNLIFQEDKKNDDNGNNNNGNYDDDDNKGDNDEIGDDGSGDNSDSGSNSNNKGNINRHNYSRESATEGKRNNDAKEEIGEEDSENQMPLTVENYMITLNKIKDVVEKELNKTDQQNTATQQEMVETQRDQNQINVALNLARKYLQPKKPSKNS
uniref:Uncharacterized protein n=1 Tax=Panagrolaimus sp. PS1159 TaxID=55785 RepID=A0AC35FSB4_9BILA